MILCTLSPTTARLLARRLTPENHRELLSAASGLGKEDVEELLAARIPEAEAEASVRKVQTAAMATVPPMGASPAMSAASEVGAAPEVGDPAAPLSSATPEAAGAITGGAISCSIPAPARPTVRPIAAERHEVRFTADGENARETEARRTCSAVPFPPATWHRCSIGRCRRSSTSWCAGNSRPLSTRVAVADR